MPTRKVNLSANPKLQTENGVFSRDSQPESAPRAMVAGFHGRRAADGRGFRTLNIDDDFTRDCVAIEVDRSLSI